MPTHAASLASRGFRVHTRGRAAPRSTGTWWELLRKNQQIRTANSVTEAEVKRLRTMVGGA